VRRNSKIKSILRSITKKSEFEQQSTPTPEVFSTGIKQNLEKLKKYFGANEDVVYRHFQLFFDDGSSLEALLVLVDGLADEDALRNNILQPLINSQLKLQPKENKLDKVKNKVSVFNTISKEKQIENAILQVLKGSSLILVDGFDEGLCLKVAGYELRSIAEPETERTVRGPHDGFIESSGTNMALIRRRLPHPSLQFETIQIGTYSQTDVTVAFIKDIAEPKVVERVKKRLKQMKVDEVTNSGEIEQTIEDHPYSIFPTIGNTGRPDKASAMLMEGRVLILVDGDSVVLYAPYLFVENMQSVEDYTSRPYYSSFIRLLRIMAFLLAILSPAIYVAILNFHKVMIPSDIVVPLIQARETVPFPLAMEIIIIILMFETVREAGIRLPQQVGSALSIVGALIFGQVAVSAGIVGAPTTIVVSISYISSFINTSISDVISLLRIALFVAASIFGGYGLIIALLGLLTHMVSLTSVGVPHMGPMAPFYFRDWKDAFIRAPYRWLKQRPNSIPSQRKTRIESLPKTGDK